MNDIRLNDALYVLSACQEMREWVDDFADVESLRRGLCDAVSTPILLAPPSEDRWYYKAEGTMAVAWLEQMNLFAMLGMPNSSKTEDWRNEWAEKFTPETAKLVVMELIRLADEVWAMEDRRDEMLKRPDANNWCAPVLNIKVHRPLDWIKHSEWYMPSMDSVITGSMLERAWATAMSDVLQRFVERMDWMMSEEGLSSVAWKTCGRSGGWLYPDVTYIPDGLVYLWPSFKLELKKYRDMLDEAMASAMEIEVEFALSCEEEETMGT